MQIPSIGYQWQNYAKFCPIELFAAKKAQFEPGISNQDIPMKPVKSCRITGAPCST